MRQQRDIPIRGRVELKIAFSAALVAGVVCCVWLFVPRHPASVVQAAGGHPMSLSALTSLQRMSATAAMPTETQPTSTQRTDGIEEAVVAPMDFSTSLSVVGTIVPAQNVAVLAPFDGVVKQQAFTYGQSVHLGDELLTLNSTDIERQMRAAEIEYIKAKQAEGILNNWSNSPEVLRVAGSLESAQTSLKAINRKITETKALLDKGLVARSEYDELVQQKNDKIIELSAAKADYTAILAKGGDAERSIARLALANAQAEMLQKQRQAGGSVVRAPADGVLSRPTSAKSNEGSNDVFAGVRLSAGQVIGVIAKGDKLGVLFHLSEDDADQIHEGQKVLVTGSGFPGLTISGHVIRVATESSGSAQDMSSFEGVAELDVLGANDRSRVRFGMTADVKIMLRNSGGVLVIPPQAVIGAGSDAEVDVKQPGTNDVRRVKVGVGDVTPTGVEVRSGLHPGDVVIWHVAPQIAPRQ